MNIKGKLQTAAVANFKHVINTNFVGAEDTAFPITNEFTFVDAGFDGAVWVRVQPDMPQLGECNLLRALCRMDCWNVLITKRGAVRVYSCPKSMEQFAGRRNIYGFMDFRNVRVSPTSATE